MWIIMRRKNNDFLGVKIVKEIKEKKIIIVDGEKWISLGVMKEI